MTGATEEVWKDIPGYNGAYQVSNLGQVRSRKRGSWKIIKETKKDNGYLVVMLSSDKMRQHYVHRLVAQAFLPNPQNLGYVNHKNEKKDDNRASNLEWCTAYYNNHYSDIYKHTRKRVVQYSKDMVRIRSYSSQGEASRLTGIYQSNISHVCHRKRETAGGYFWRFE